MYGMVAEITDENLTEEFVVHYMDQIYRYKWEEKGNEEDKRRFEWLYEVIYEAI